MKSQNEPYSDEKMRIVIYHLCHSSARMCKMMDEHDIYLEEIGKVESSLELALGLVQNLKQIALNDFKKDMERQL